MRITNTKPVFAKAMTLAGVLAEIDTARPMMPERADWFRTVLGNAIANAEQDIRFLTAYEGYSAEKKAESIGKKQDRITRCNAAIAKLGTLRNGAETMKTPAPTWDTSYQHDRRNARHRCRCCARVLNAGDSVIMARVGAQKTWAIHTECGEKQHGTADWTWRDAMVSWGNEYLKACGWKVAA